MHELLKANWGQKQRSNYHEGPRGEGKKREREVDGVLGNGDGIATCGGGGKGGDGNRLD